MTITQTGGVYRLEGTDNQCGGGRDQAAVQGLAFPNSDGTIGFGLTIVTAPGGAPVHVDAEIALATLSGTWRDSANGTGTFAFTSGPGSGGSPRPAPSSAIPTAIRLLNDGGFVAGGAQGAGVIPASGGGTRMMWHPAKAAFRAGYVGSEQWNEANVGLGSFASGLDTRASGHASAAVGSGTSASGPSSFAMGSGTFAVGTAAAVFGGSTVAYGPLSVAMGWKSEASGFASVAMGFDTRATKDHSLAMGEKTRATEINSTALGESTTASGKGSTAMGLSTTASGTNSLAIGVSSAATGRSSFAGGERAAAGDVAFGFGVEARADGPGSFALGTRAFTATDAVGSFAFADNSSTTPFGSLGPREFNARFAQGYQFYTNAAATLGAWLKKDATAWTVLSDVNVKQDFRELDGEDVLRRIAAMPVTEWSYRAQAPGVRHIGPTAQDFHAAFGLGNDRLGIETLDADGVALAGVKALEARSRALQSEVDALRQRLEALLSQQPRER